MVLWFFLLFTSVSLGLPLVITLFFIWSMLLGTRRWWHENWRKEENDPAFLNRGVLKSKESGLPRLNCMPSSSIARKTLGTLLLYELDRYESYNLFSNLCWKEVGVIPTSGFQDNVFTFVNNSWGGYKVFFFVAKVHLYGLNKVHRFLSCKVSSLQD